MAFVALGGARAPVRAARRAARCTMQADALTANVRFGGIQHAGVIVSDTRRALKFYLDILGMEDDTALRSKKLPFDGAFVKAGNQQLHLMELPNPDPIEGRPEHGGRDHHVAFTVSNIEPLKESLDSHGIAYTMSKSGRRALFCRDYDANALEFIETQDV